MLGNDFHCFWKTSIGILPASAEKDPMLKNHCNQLGIKFTQNPPGLFTSPTVNLAVAFPEFEQQFDLPAHSGEHKGFIGTQKRFFNIGHKEIEVGKSQLAL